MTGSDVNPLILSVVNCLLPVCEQGEGKMMAWLTLGSELIIVAVWAKLRGRRVVTRCDLFTWLMSNFLFSSTVSLCIPWRILAVARRREATMFNVTFLAWNSDVTLLVLELLDWTGVLKLPKKKRKSRSSPKGTSIYYVIPKGGRGVWLRKYNVICEQKNWKKCRK